MLPKSILGLLLGLHSRNVRNNLQANPHDKARKWKTYLMLIMHLKHSKHNMLAETEGKLLN
jgi:F420-0:gamma-glutamyl ligase-like protein